MGALRRLALGGARWIEYRDKQADEAAVQATAIELVAAAAPLGVAVLINDNVRAAVASGAAGAHLGQDDDPIVDARRLLGADALIGISVDTVAEAEAAAAAAVDYVAIGPVFPTASKADAGPVVGIDGVRAAAAAIGKPLVAIGGIDADNAAAITAAGADCVAAISAFFGGDPLENTRRMLAAAQHGIDAR